MYRDGQGLPQDHVRAYLWFSLASDADEDALKMRDELSKKITPRQITKAKKMATEWLGRKEEN